MESCPGHHRATQHSVATALGLWQRISLAGAAGTTEREKRSAEILILLTGWIDPQTPFFVKRTREVASYHSGNKDSMGAASNIASFLTQTAIRRSRRNLKRRSSENDRAVVTSWTNLLKLSPHAALDLRSRCCVENAQAAGLSLTTYRHSETRSVEALCGFAARNRTSAVGSKHPGCRYSFSSPRGIYHRVRYQ